MANRSQKNRERQYIVFSHSCSEAKLEDGFAHTASLVFDVHQGYYTTDTHLNFSPDDINSERHLALANKVNAYLNDFEQKTGQQTYAYLLTARDKSSRCAISQIDNSIYGTFIFPEYQQEHFKSIINIQRAPHLENPSLLNSQRDRVIKTKILELQKVEADKIKYHPPESYERSQYSENPKRALKGFFSGTGIGIFVAFAIGIAIPVVGLIATIAICAIAGAIGFIYGGAKIDEYREKQVIKETLEAGENPDVGLSFHGSNTKRTFSQQAELETVQLTVGHERTPIVANLASTPRDASDTSIGTVTSVDSVDIDDPPPRASASRKTNSFSPKGPFQRFAQAKLHGKCYQSLVHKRSRTRCSRSSPHG